MCMIMSTCVSKRLIMAQIGLAVVLFKVFSPSLLAAPANVCGSVEFSTQAQVDAFDQGCTIIDGHLTIVGDDIQNLSRLGNIQQVDSLQVILTTKLSNLSGLSALTTATQCVVIEQNANLVSLTGLEKLATIGGEPNLGANCQVFGLGLHVMWNNHLRDLDGLKVLSSLVGNLSVVNNDDLDDVRGLAALSDVTLDILEVRDNATMTHLDGLEGLIGARTLNISYNDRLLHVDGLRNLQRIYDPATTFNVLENPRLSRCEGLAPFFYWPGSESLRDISIFEDNDVGCDTIDQLWASVVMTAPVIRSLTAANGRMAMEFTPATVNTALFPVRGHNFYCSGSEPAATQLTFPLRTIANGQTITESHYFSTDIREGRLGQASYSRSIWSPYFQAWHPVPSELSATMVTPWGEEILLLDQFDIDSGDDNRFVFPNDVYRALQGTEDESRVFPGLWYLRGVDQELQGTYEVTFTDSIITNSYGRLNSWGVMAGNELAPNTSPVQGSSVALDTVLNELEYDCLLEPETLPLSGYEHRLEFEFTSDLTEPQSAPQIVSVTPQADGEASILVEFSQPWAWHAELQDYLVTCEAEGEEPAYGYALADNGNANQVMAADGSVTQAILVEGVSEEVEYSCSVTGYNRRGGGPASNVANVTTEAVIRGLPIWLLYEATRAP